MMNNELYKGQRWMEIFFRFENNINSHVNFLFCFSGNFFLICLFSAIFFSFGFCFSLRSNAVYVLEKKNANRIKPTDEDGGGGCDAENKKDATNKSRLLLLFVIDIFSLSLFLIKLKINIPTTKNI